MLMSALGEYLDLLKELGKEDEGARRSLLGYAEWMLRYSYVGASPSCSVPHFVYRWKGDGEVWDWSLKGGANAWMLVVSDAFTYAWKYSCNSTYLEVVAQQYEYGSKYFWYEGNSIGQFATGKQHIILSTSGYMYPRARATRLLYGRRVYLGDAPGAKLNVAKPE